MVRGDEERGRCEGRGGRMEVQRRLLAEDGLRKQDSGYLLKTIRMRTLVIRGKTKLHFELWLLKEKVRFDGEMFTAMNG